MSLLTPELFRRSDITPEVGGAAHSPSAQIRRDESLQRGELVERDLFPVDVELPRAGHSLRVGSPLPAGQLQALVQLSHRSASLGAALSLRAAACEVRDGERAVRTGADVPAPHASHLAGLRDLPGQPVRDHPHAPHLRPRAEGPPSQPARQDLESLRQVGRELLIRAARDRLRRVRKIRRLLQRRSRRSLSSLLTRP